MACGGTAPGRRQKRTARSGLDGAEPAACKNEVTERDQAVRKGAPAAAACLVAGIVLAIGLPTLNNGFVALDDPTYVVSKPVSSGLTVDGFDFAFTALSPYWHPLTWLSHELDAELFGSAPTGHHFTSVMLHALTAGLLCLTFMWFGADLWLAAAAALLWGLHPLRVESFAWVAERKDVLCALFFVATAAAYLRYQKHPGRARYVPWLLCGALALMSKPTAVTLPLVLLLLDLWPGRRRAPLWRLIAEKIPLAAIAAAVTVLTVVGQRRDGATSLVPNLSLGTRLANASVSYARYLGKMLWPVNLACHYPYERHLPLPWVLLSAVLLVGVSVAAATQWRRRPWLTVGWAWFVVTLLPNAGLVRSGAPSDGRPFHAHTHDGHRDWGGVDGIRVGRCSARAAARGDRRRSGGAGGPRAFQHQADRILARQHQLVRACDRGERQRLYAGQPGDHVDGSAAV